MFSFLKTAGAAWRWRLAAALLLGWFATGTAHAQLVEWARPAWPLDTTGRDEAFFGRLLVDPHGDLYQVVRFKGWLRLDSISPPIQADVPAVAPGTLLLVKRAPDGTVLWTLRSHGGAGVFGSIPEAGATLSLDSQGNVYLAATYSNGMRFGSLTLPAITGTGQVRPFVLKVSAGGQPLSLQAVRAPATVMADGDLLLTDVFTRAVTFGTTTLTPVAGRDCRYVVRLDPTGTTVRWTKVVGFSPGSQYQQLKLTAAPTGEVLIGMANANGGDSTMLFDGRTIGLAGFDGGFCVARVDAGGTTSWVQSFSGLWTPFSMGNLSFDASGNCLVTGDYFGVNAPAPMINAGLTFPPHQEAMFLACLQATTGQGRWVVLGDPQGPNVVAYSDGYALPDATGDLYWVFGLNFQFIFSSTSGVGGGYFQYSNRSALARVSATGRVLWTFEACTPIRLAPHPPGESFPGELALDPTSHTMYLQNRHNGYIQYGSNLIYWRGATVLTRFNNNPVGAGGQAAGRVFLDLDRDGTYTAADSSHAFRFTMVQADNSYFTTIPGATGLYTLLLPGPTHTLALANPPRYHTVVPGTRNATFSTTGQWLPNQDFAIQPTPGIQDLAVNANGWLRLGDTTTYSVTVTNFGTTSPTTAAAVVQVDPRLTVVRALTPGAVVTGNTVTWPLPNLRPNAQFVLRLAVAVPTTASRNTRFGFRTTATPVAIDVTPADNERLDSLRAGTSLDPNLLTVSPDGAITPAQVAAGQWLAWTIDFQNTGTDTAFFVQLRDTLDLSSLDLSSLEVLAASHPGSFSWQPGGTLVWTSRHIQLPPTRLSTDNSHGFVSFRLKCRPTVTLGEVIGNRAHITFDFNAPLATNATATPVAWGPLGESAELGGHQAFCYPSPTTGLLHVQGPGAERVHVQVLDALGRAVQTAQLPQGAGWLDLRSEPPGVYLLRLTRTDGWRTTQRVVRIP